MAKLRQITDRLPHLLHGRKKMVLCPLVTRPPRVHPWDRKFGSEKAPPTTIKKKAFCPLATRPPRVHPWDRKFGSEKAFPPMIKKKDRRPLATPPPCGFTPPERKFG